MKTLKELMNEQKEELNEDLFQEGGFTMALAERKIASHSKKVKSEKDPIKQNVLISRMIHTLAVSLTYLKG